MLTTANDNFEVTSILDTYTLEGISTDITTLNVFKNNDAYKGYISIINVRYDIVNEELITTSIDGYNSAVSDSGSEYYMVMDFYSIFNKICEQYTKSWNYSIKVML